MGRKKISKKNLVLETRRGPVHVCDDLYSDRLRCDHPPDVDALWLGENLIREAEARGRGKVLTLVREDMIPQLQRVGFRVAAHLPDFYAGEAPCGVLTHNVDSNRLRLANPKEVARVHKILREVKAANVELEAGVPPKTELMKTDDAADVARLLGRTFPEYPTPSHDPAYLLEQRRDGVPFRLIRDQDEKAVIACASADLIKDAKTAELTDCATNPEFRGRGYMKLLLIDLMKDLRKRNYPTAFTMARARIPGINILFKQLGFRFCGQVSQSCRIGEGLEDINLWIRRL